jgi:protein-tyrosine phosphatase
MQTIDLPRVLALQGATNVRDLGGWPAGDGRRVRFGKVFRSASLAALTEEDAAALAGVGIRTICDLRGETERQRAPSRLTGVTTHALCIEPSLRPSLSELLAAGTVTGEAVMALMRGAYTAYAMEWSHRYRALFDLLLDEEAPPLLFHCTAGKDRTGFGAALILAALGVDEAAVLEDYLATNQLWRADPEVAAALPEAVAEVLLSVHPEMIAAAFDAARDAHGTIDAYLEARIGLGPAARERLRERYLE